MQEARAHVPKISDQFWVHTDGCELAILLADNTVLPDAQAIPIAEASTCWRTWQLVALIVRRHVSTTCNRSQPHSRGVRCTCPRSKTVRPLLLRRFRDHTVWQEVDFVCGYFNITVNGPLAGSFVEHRSAPDSHRPHLLHLRAQSLWCWRVTRHGCHHSRKEHLGLALEDNKLPFPSLHACDRHDEIFCRVAGLASRMARAVTKNVERKLFRKREMAAADHADAYQ